MSPLKAQSEAAFQQQVVNLAAYYGWRTYHTHDSRRSNPGFPDLVLVRPPELLFVELKTDKGRVRYQQQDWLDDLATVGQAVARAVAAVHALDEEPKADQLPAVEAHLWRPQDFDALHTRLARGRHRSEPISA